mgnify:CR=1 FL=1
MHVLYQKETDTRARVTTQIFQPAKVDQATLANAIDVGDLPEPNIDTTKYRPLPYVNPQTAEVWYEGVGKPLSRMDFRRLFTFEERVRIKSGQKADGTALADIDKAKLAVVQDDVLAAEEILLDDPEVVEMVNWLEQIGVLESGRAAEVLG